MSFKLTQEQEHIVDAISNPSCSLLKISAVAGSGKTSTLIAIANHLHIKHGLYLAFNKSIADEARRKFPYTIECRTLHSLAHTFVIKGSNRKIDNLTYTCITEDLSYEVKQSILSTIDNFFTSDALDYSYFDEKIPQYSSICANYVDKMIHGEIACTFNFCLKYFHLLLANDEIKIPTYDVLFLDEAGDTTAVTLAIFQLLKSPKKVMVGDPEQNIYTFMNTINGFEILKDEGVLYPLSQSFRVGADIAHRVEIFCQKNLNPSMRFRGINFKDTQIHNIAYLSRTNATMIGRMIQLIELSTPFTLLRPVDEIFDLPLFLISLRPYGMTNIPHKYKYIYNEYQHFLSDTALQHEFKHFFLYFEHIFSYDISLLATIRLLRKHGFTRILDTYKRVKQMPRRLSPVTLSTAFTAKGREWDQVTIEPDLNKVILRILEKGGPDNTEELTELRLGYVAATRARLQLLNCEYL